MSAIICKNCGQDISKHHEKSTWLLGGYIPATPDDPLITCGFTPQQIAAAELARLERIEKAAKIYLDYFDKGCTCYDECHCGWLVNLDTKLDELEQALKGGESK